MCGVLVSDWAGYQSPRKEKGVGMNQTRAGPAHEVPTSMSPVVP